MVVDDDAVEAPVDENLEKSPSKTSLWEVYEGITPWDDKKVDVRMHEIYDRVVHWDDGELNHTGQERMENTPTTGEIAKKKDKQMMAPFKETFLYQVVDHISQASKLGLSVILVDCVTFFARMMGYSTEIMKNVPRIYSKVAYTGWITHRLQIMKRHFLEKTLVKSYGKLWFISYLIGHILSCFALFDCTVLKVVISENYTSWMTW